MDETEVRRAEPDSPTRCQAMTSKGQCSLEAMAGFKNCKCHGGAAAAHGAQKNSNRLYQLTKFGQELDRHADHSGIKSLRDEIGILRMTLEIQLNKCNDATDLLLSSARISDLISRIEKLVVSCHKIEQSTGALLDKQTVLSFAQQVVALIALVLKGQEDLIAEIAEGIMGILKQLDQPQAPTPTPTPTPAPSLAITSEADELEDEE